MPVATPEVLPCPPEGRPEALALLYRRASASARARLVAEALADEAQGGLDLSGLWVARRRGRVVGALLTQPLNGRAGAVWPPEVEPGWGRPALAAALVRAALGGLRSRGVRLAQALLDPASPTVAAADLARGGLPRVTDLISLRRGTSPPLAVRPGVPPLDWRTYAPETAAAFAEALDASYLGSLDMPELEGARSLADVLEGHRASGRFDPHRWRVGHLPGDPAPSAILLLADPPDRPAWEVAYLGLAPRARGLGLGRAALAHALDLARPHAPTLELAVDARNLPALRLYRGAGFIEHDRRSVHLALLPPRFLG